VVAVVQDVLARMALLVVRAVVLLVTLILAVKLHQVQELAVKEIMAVMLLGHIFTLPVAVAVLLLLVETGVGLMAVLVALVRHLHLIV
jgi:hypothetical protein